MKAYEYIEKHGWLQGKAHDNEGRVCMLQALHITYTGEEYCRIRSRVAKEVRKYGFGLLSDNRVPDHFVIPYFNDYVLTTKAMVLKVLRTVEGD